MANLRIKEISNNFEYKILNQISDEESRVLTLDLLIENDF